MSATVPSSDSRLGRTKRPAAWGLALVVGTVVWLGAACSSGPKRDAKAFCADYVEVARSGMKIADPDDVSVATLRTQVQHVDDAASNAAKRAPDDIAKRVDNVIAPLHDLRKGLDDATTRTQATTALRRYATDVAKHKVDQQVLDLWAAQNCGVVPVTTTTVPVTVTPGVTG